MKAVKNIEFELSLKGRGIVNYDSSDKSWASKKYGVIGDFDPSNSNFKIAKKTFTKDGYKVKISSNLMRKAMYENEMDCITPEVQYSNVVLQSAISTPALLTRGYMFPDLELKRKSVLSISDAIQTNDTKVVMETCTSTGGRTNTSLFSVETAGEMEYKSRGNINIKDIQFISSDPRFGRMAVNADWMGDKQVFGTCLRNNIPNASFTEGYFMDDMSINKFGRYAERGIKFSDDTVKWFIKYLLKKLVAIRVDRAGSFVEVESLRIKLVSDFDDHLSDSWLDIKSESDIESLNMNVHDFFCEIDESDVLKTKTEIDSAIEAKDSKKKADKASKKKKAE